MCPPLFGSGKPRGLAGLAELPDKAGDMGEGGFVELLQVLYELRKLPGVGIAGVEEFPGGEPEAVADIEEYGHGGLYAKIVYAYNWGLYGSREGGY